MSQKALVLSTPSSRHEVKTVSIPKPGPGQILVKVEAAALNPFDVKLPKFTFFNDSYPLVPGFDGAGTIVEVGSDVSGFQKGDRLVFQGWNDYDAKVLYGTFQEYTIAIPHAAAKLPDNISFKAGSTIFTALSTSAVALFSKKPDVESLRLSPPWEDGLGKYAGQSALVIGGSSNLGQYAIQLAKLAGFSQIITTASLHNTELLKLNGATHVIDRKLPSEKIVDEVKAIVGEPGVDLVYDSVSNEDTLGVAVTALRPGGGLVYVILAAVELAQKLAAVKGQKSACARGMMSMGTNPGALAGLWENLPQLLESGALKTTPFEVLPGGLRGVTDGLKRLENGEVSGVKLIVIPSDTTE